MHANSIITITTARPANVPINSAITTILAAHLLSFSLPLLAGFIPSGLVVTSGLTWSSRPNGDLVSGGRSRQPQRGRVAGRALVSLSVHRPYAHPQHLLWVKGRSGVCRGKMKVLNFYFFNVMC